MAKKKEIRLKKIPLEVLLEVLTEIFDMGVDYVDIVGVPDEIQDTIGIVYTKDYMSKELQDKVDEIIDDFIDDNITEKKKDVKLSDDDLNQII